MIERIDVSDKLGINVHEIWAPDHLQSIAAGDHNTLLEKLELVAAATEGSIPHEVVDQSLEFASSAAHKFAAYSRGEKSDDEQRGHAFLIPVTIGESPEKPGEDFREIDTAMPMLRYVDRATEHRTLLSLPPSEVGVYVPHLEGQKQYGTAMYTPITMEIFNQNGRKALSVARSIVNRTVDFAHHYYGIDLIGLGGVIPAFTRYGSKIDVEGVETTTGHGGTVWLIHKNLEAVENEFEFGRVESVGIVGAGSIGYATAVDLLTRRPDVRLRLFDNNAEKLDATTRKLVDQFGEMRVNKSQSLKDVIEGGSVTISAITGKFDEDPQYDTINFAGKVIIDDSHPNSASRTDLESRGGRVVGVFGDAHGVIDREPVRADMPAVRYCGGKVAGPNDVWGCEAEVNVLAIEPRAFQPITGAVTIENVREVGKAFDRLGIGAAKLQSYGRYILPFSRIAA